MEQQVTTPAPAPEAVVNAPEQVAPQAPPKVDNVPTTKEEMRELIINGVPRKLTQKEIEAKAVLGFGAYEKFEKAAAIEKREAQRKEKLQKDIIGTLMEEGFTKEQIREKFENWYKESVIDPETLSPEQMELRELKKFKEQKDKEAQDAKEKEEMTRKEREDAESRDLLQKEIIEALDASGLPKSRFNAGRFAYWMRQNLSKGYNAPKEVLIQQVKDERQGLVREEIDNLSGDEMVNLLGDQVINKLRKFDLENLKKKFGSQPTQINKSRPQSSKRSMSDVDEYFNQLRRSK